LFYFVFQWIGQWLLHKQYTTGYRIRENNKYLNEFLYRNKQMSIQPEPSR